jgi:hypothetical protein
MSEDYYQATRLTMAWERTKRRRERRRKRRVAKMFRVQLGCTKQEFNRLGFSAWVMGKKALYDRAEIQLERDY